MRHEARVQTSLLDHSQVCARTDRYRERYQTALLAVPEPTCYAALWRALDESWKADPRPR